MERLRLFPLRTVLFPGMPLALQVFEERYRTLVAECLEHDEAFGVVLIKDGPEVGGNAVPHSMGTAARIRRVAPTRDGRLALEAVGERRFRILRTFDDLAYLSAEVEYPVDEVVDVPDELLTQTRSHVEQLQRLRHTIANEYHREVPVPESAGAVADAIGAYARGLTTDRTLQRLLTTLNVRRRLEDASEIVAAVIAATHEQAAAVVAQRWSRVDRRN
jgi:Lon protease-like protein